jgi:hypothetical protein
VKASLAERAFGPVVEHSLQQAVDEDSLDAIEDPDARVLAMLGARGSHVAAAITAGKAIR